MARQLLPREAAPAPLARALRDPLRHGRGQQHLLRAAEARDRRRLDRTDAARVPVLGQGEPLHHPHQASQEPGEVRRALSRGDRAAARSEAGRGGPLAASALVQARRRAPRRGPRRDHRPGAGPPRGRGAPPELVHRGRLLAARRARGGAGDRRRPGAAVRRAPADELVGLRAPAPGQPRLATRRASWPAGGGESPPGARGPRRWSTSTTRRPRRPRTHSPCVRG